jgi:hypothetical protein
MVSAGMYSKADWGGPVDPFILTVFPNKTVQGDADPVVSLVIFEWKDQDLVGINMASGDNGYTKEYICDQSAVSKGYCNETDLDEFILAPNATEKSTALILTQAVHLKSSTPINYPIKKTGYYCVGAFSKSDDFMAVVEFREAYGELPATQIPKLPFYGGVTILYAVVVV